MSNQTVLLFVTGLVFGTALLVLGLMLGYWFARRDDDQSETLSETPDQRQFLMFLSNLSRWTDELSGDVSKYHTQLSSLSRQISTTSDTASKEDFGGLIQQFMSANLQLQTRLDNAEEKLESQTKEIAAYLTEARTDGLTGLANRRAFDSCLDEKFAEFANQGEPFSLVLVDIDFFKKINDTYGHPAGDSVLREMARRLSDHLSDAFQVARFGGEEFAILLPGGLAETATQIDAVRIEIVQELFPTESESLKVTMSCGVAQVEPNERIGKLVRRADEALYAAKLGGRNRVYKHDGTLCHLVGKPEELLSDSLNQPANKVAEENASAQNADDNSLEAQIHARLDRIVAEESKRQRT